MARGKLEFLTLGAVLFCIYCYGKTIFTRKTGKCACSNPPFIFNYSSLFWLDTFPVQTIFPRWYCIKRNVWAERQRLYQCRNNNAPFKLSVFYFHCSFFCNPCYAEYRTNLIPYCKRQRCNGKSFFCYTDCSAGNPAVNIYYDIGWKQL